MTVGSAIQGLAIRVKRLDANGNPTGDVVVSDGFIRTQSQVRSQAGTETVVRNAAGGICVQKKTPDQVTGTDITIDWCRVDPELFDIVSTTRPVLNCDGEVAGFQQGTRSKTGYFSLEIWSSVVGGDMGAFMYSLFPKVAVGMVGGTVTWEDGPQTWTLTAPAEANPNWGNGQDLVAHPAGVTTVIPPDGGQAVVLCDSVDVDSFFYSVATNVSPPAMVTNVDTGGGAAADQTYEVSGKAYAAATIADLKADPVYGEAASLKSPIRAAFSPAQYVLIGLPDGTADKFAVWDGTNWTSNAAAPDVTDVSSLFLGDLGVATGTLTLVGLNADGTIGTAGTGAPFNGPGNAPDPKMDVGSFVLTSDGKAAYWDGTAWVAGVSK